jgi:hypothetical protein
MKSITLVLAIALGFTAAGCKKKGGADCQKAIDHSMELSKPMMEKMPGMDDATMQKMKDLGLQHCKDDKWSDEAVKCMIDAKSMEEAQGCYQKLSKEQRQSMNKAAMEMQPTGGAAGSAAPAAPPPGGEAGSAAPAPAGSAAPAAAGSDMGSAK